MQVDSIKTRVESKAPLFQRLKLKCDERLSKFAFKFNLRRFTKAAAKRAEVAASRAFDNMQLTSARAEIAADAETDADRKRRNAMELRAWAYTRPLFNST